MKIPVCIIERFEYDRNKSKYSDTASVLDRFTSVNISYGFKDKKDTFSLSLIPYKRFNSVTQQDDYNVPNINSNDLINIYVYYEDDPTLTFDVDGVTLTNLGDYLLFNGVVDKFSYSSNGGVYTLDVSGNNRTEILLNNMIFFQYNKTIIPDMLADVAVKLRTMNKNKPLFIFKDYKGDGTDVGATPPQAYNSLNENFYGTTIPGYSNWGTVPRGGIRAYKKDAYAYNETYGYWQLKDGINLNEIDSDGNYVYRFPERQYYETYKSLYSHLDVLSGFSYTNDRTAGTYITFVTSDNVLYWRPKKTTIDTNALESETMTTTVTREIRDVINATIINVGTDVKGRGILALSYNTASMVEFGAKWKYLTKPNISEQIMNKQKLDSGVSYNTDDNFPASYPVQVKVPATSNINDSSTGSPIWEYNIGDNINNDSAFNEYIRQVSRQAGKDYGADYTSNNSNSRFFLKMKLDIGSNEFQVGDFINVEVPSLHWDGLNTVNLRVQEIKHSIASDGWNTELTLEEDIDDIKTKDWTVAEWAAR